MQIYVAGVSEVRKIDDYTVDFISPTASDPAEEHHRFPHHEQVWRRDRSQNIQTTSARRDVCLAQRERHRPVRSQGWEPDKQIVFTVNKTVGQARRQHQRLYLHADQVRRHRVAALLSGDVDMVTDCRRRTWIGCAGTTSSRSSTATRCAPSSSLDQHNDDCFSRASRQNRSRTPGTAGVNMAWTARRSSA